MFLSVGVLVYCSTGRTKMLKGYLVVHIIRKNQRESNKFNIIS